MLTFAQLIRQIRDEADLTQAQFAKAIGISPVLVAMLETGQKEVSKKLLLKLAKALNVHPASITPFIFLDKKSLSGEATRLEQILIRWGEKMQKMLIKDRAKLLKKYAK
jgi:transcriptional regulator with XRE-family HTH domain